MNRRELELLRPVMAGFVALRDLMAGQEFEAAMEQMAGADEVSRENLEEITKATQLREAAAKRNEDALAANKMVLAEMRDLKAENEAGFGQLNKEREEFGEYRLAETERLTEWEQRLNAIPDTEAEAEERLAQATDKRTRAAALEQQYLDHLEKLGLQPAA